MLLRLSCFEKIGGTARTNGQKDGLTDGRTGYINVI